MLSKLMWLALAGAVGTLARYGLGGLVQKWAGNGFPWGTLAINVLGCFLFGMVWALGTDRMLLSAETRSLILIGFMGAFTTFSTFAAESGQMLADLQWARACGNILLQNVGGIGFFFVGLAVGRWF